MLILDHELVSNVRIAETWRNLKEFAELSSIGKRSFIICDRISSLRCLKHSIIRDELPAHPCDRERWMVVARKRSGLSGNCLAIRFQGFALSDHFRSHGMNFMNCMKWTAWNEWHDMNCMKWTAWYELLEMNYMKFILIIEITFLKLNTLIIMNSVNGANSQ